MAVASKKRTKPKKEQSRTELYSGTLEKQGLTLHDVVCEAFEKAKKDSEHFWLKASIPELKNNVKSLEEELAAAKEQIQTGNEYLTQVVSENSKRQEEDKNKISSLQREQEEYKKKFREREKQLLEENAFQKKEFDNQISKLHSELNDSTLSTDNILELKQAIKKQQEEKKKDRIKHKEEIDRLNRIHKTKVTNLETKIKEIDTNLRTEIETKVAGELENETKQAILENQSLTKEVFLNSQHAKHLLSENDVLRAEVERLKGCVKQLETSETELLRHVVFYQKVIKKFRSREKSKPGGLTELTMQNSIPQGKLIDVENQQYIPVAPIQPRKKPEKLKRKSKAIEKHRERYFP